MLETTWLFVLAAAHVTGLGAVLLGFRVDWAEVVTIAALLSFVLFGIAAMGATNVEVVTDSGQTVRQAQPGMGWYAMGMALLAGIVAVAAGLEWLKDVMEDTSYGSNY